MTELLTIDALMRATETELPLPEDLAKLLGRPTLKVCKLDGGRFGCLFPLMPVDLVTEPDPVLAKDGTAQQKQATLAHRERLWLGSLPAADRIRYRLEVESVKFHVLALTALDPRLTLAQAERFGSAADDLYREILIFSGLVQAPPAATPVATGEPVAA